MRVRVCAQGAIVSGTAGAKAASLPGENDFLRGHPSAPESDSVSALLLAADFKAIDVSQQAKETCRNWSVRVAVPVLVRSVGSCSRGVRVIELMRLAAHTHSPRRFYKTACIRELMPRLYVDLALIKSYRFIEDGPYHEILARISRTVRGIGDPLAGKPFHALSRGTLSRVSIRSLGRLPACWLRSHSAPSFCVPFIATYARAYVATKALDLAGVRVLAFPHVEFVICLQVAHA